MERRLIQIFHFVAQQIFTLLKTRAAFSAKVIFIKLLLLKYVVQTPTLMIHPHNHVNFAQGLSAKRVLSAVKLGTILCIQLLDSYLARKVVLLKKSMGNLAVKV